MKNIPELKTLQPAVNQHELPAILAKAGDSVNEYVDTWLTWWLTTLQG